MIEKGLRPDPPDSPASDPHRADPDEMVVLSTRPGLHSNGQRFGLLALIVQMMRRSLDQNAPSLLACGAEVPSAAIDGL
jgi:hypothetical protein